MQMTAEINTHFILVKWVCNQTVEGSISGFQIVNIGEYYKWKSNLEISGDEITIPISNKSDHIYPNGKAFLNDVSCSILDKNERDTIVQSLGESFGVTTFMNYRTPVETKALPEASTEGIIEKCEEATFDVSKVAKTIDRIVLGNIEQGRKEARKTLKDIKWTDSRFARKVKDAARRANEKLSKIQDGLGGALAYPGKSSEESASGYKESYVPPVNGEERDWEAQH